MLNVQLSSHREMLPAETADQKLFVMLKLRPTNEASAAKPSTTFVFLIDTSGSMYEVVAGDRKPTGKTLTMDGQKYSEVVGGKTKIDIVIESLLTLIRSSKLDENDKVAIVQFADEATILAGLTPATQISKLESAIKRLRDFSGGTVMGEGMRQTLDIFSNQQGMASRRTLIFTDGQTFDEKDCKELARTFAAQNIPITALGVGDYKEDLLIDLSDESGGRLFHVVGKNPAGTQVSIESLPKEIIEEFSRAQRDVITNLGLTVKTVKGVDLIRVLRAYPDQAEFSIGKAPHIIGNASANDETVFILEFNIASRQASRARIAQIGLTYDVPGQNRRGELQPQNLIVQFTSDQGGITQVDQEVMDYMQQCNIANIVGQATKIADKEPQKAQELLETAHRMTVRIGNKELMESLGNAQDELRKTQKISSGTRKTIKMGSKGKTVRMGGDINNELSDDQIREASGT
ncbi:VWA domain-containing protein [Acaryochloris sp. 'Moss Beach']|uniref:vWA domain-containing protein n=1 Tax=Acaryochloris sp. 'Moss Beach' TaxID=2740837 RepID=UPI001F421387|nr:VWA domain-containing protein [Acaryochloris sp. 'Moss Beach']UJB68988.1 VWA domain-containing protein [Acaryochloris sp. 'Moss Beach']